MNNNNVIEKNIDTMLNHVEILKKEIKQPPHSHDANVIFRAIRLSLGLTQNEFANLLNSQVKIVSRWENKKGITPELTHKQFSILYYEMRKKDIDLLNLHCYKIVSLPDDFKMYQAVIAYS